MDFFEDSQVVETVVMTFEAKTYQDVNKDGRVKERRNFITRIILDAFRYKDLDYRIFYNNSKLIDNIAEGLYIILKESLKDCSGVFHSDPRHCADDYLKKRCKVLFKRINAETDFE